MPCLGINILKFNITPIVRNNMSILVFSILPSCPGVGEAIHLMKSPHDTRAYIVEDALLFFTIKFSRSKAFRIKSYDFYTIDDYVRKQTASTVFNWYRTLPKVSYTY